MLVALCALIAAADLAQVAVLGKGLGALGGALVYGGSAIALVRGMRRVRWLIAAMPVIPLAVFAGLLGEQTREELVDEGMIAVFVLQLAAALLALAQRPDVHRGNSQGEAS